MCPMITRFGCFFLWKLRKLRFNWELLLKRSAFTNIVCCRSTALLKLNYFKSIFKESYPNIQSCIYFTRPSALYVYPDYKQKYAEPRSFYYKHPSNNCCCKPHMSGNRLPWITIIIFLIDVGILKIPVLPEPIDCLKMLISSTL